MLEPNNIHGKVPAWDAVFDNMEESFDAVLKTAFDILTILAFIFPENITTGLIKRIYNKFYSSGFTDSQLKPSLELLLNLNAITSDGINFNINRIDQQYIRNCIAEGPYSAKINCRWKRCLQNLKQFWWSLKPTEWSSFKDLYNLLNIWQRSSSIPGLNDCRKQNIIPLFNKLAEVKWVDEKFMENAYTYNLTLKGADDFIGLLLTQPLVELKATAALKAGPLISIQDQADDDKRRTIPLDKINLIRANDPIPSEANARNDCYTPLQNRPRGFVLIVNIINVKSKERRVGAIKDAYHLLNLFEELAYKVTLVQDVMTKKEFLGEVNAFKNTLPDRTKVGSVIVICCSHGNSGFGDGSKDYLFTGKIEEIRYDEIYYLFQDTEYDDIPKIFIFQACRGEKSVKIPFKCDGDALPSSIPKHAIICYSTWHEYQSYRDEERGSWYIYSLVRVIKKLAATKDLLEILIKVGDEVDAISQNYGISKEEKAKDFQRPEYNDAQFGKTFFFNTTPVIVELPKPKI